MEADPDVCTRMCSVCGYQGKWVSEMIRHKRVHTSDRPFKCKYCNRTSKWKADLIRHVAKTHGIRVVSKYSRSKAMDLGMQQQQQQQQQQLLTVEDSADFDAFSSSSCESSAKDENNNNNGKNGAAAVSLNSQERKAQRLLSSMARNKQLVQRQRLHQQQQQQQKQEAKAETEQQQLVLNPLRAGNNDAIVGVGTTELGLPTLQRSSDASLALLQLLNILPHLAPQAREDGSTSSLFSGQLASN
uniref:C2H2-type domain-containing protein n=1 Tax=Globodera pallida TaxID=36090 RepID=A0A183BJH1_GLOPA